MESPKWVANLQAMVLRLHITLIGGFLFMGGFFLIIYSQRMGDPERTSALLKDLGFHLGTAGLILLLVEFGLRRATWSYIEKTIQAAFDNHLPPIAPAVHTMVSTAVCDEIQKSQRAVIESVEATLRDEIQRLRQAVTPNAVRDVLEAALGSGEGNLVLADDLAVTIDKLRELGSHTAAAAAVAAGSTPEAEAGKWAKGVYRVYREYLSLVISNVKNNANALCKAAGEKTPSGEAHEVKLVSPAERSNFILSHLMSVMQPGAEYCVFSDIQSWMDDSFNVFFLKNLEAVKNGVRIRRIFIVKPEQLLHGLSPDAVRKVLEAHLAATMDADGSPTGYSVRLFDTFKYAHLLQGKSDDVDAEHYGIFIPAEGDFCLQFEVVRRHFSRVNLVNLTRDEARTEFDGVWDVLGVDLDRSTLDSAYLRWRTLFQNP